MKINFDEKTAIVTGATRGIGKVIADNLEDNGATVVRTGKHNLDFTKDCIDFFQDVVRQHNHIDVLINNAAIHDGTLGHVLAVNLSGPYVLIKQLAPIMKGGKIVNIASISSVVAMKNYPLYTMTKTGLIGLTRSAAVDFARYNILVNAVSPGTVDTGMTSEIGSAERKRRIDDTPLGRLATPQDISNVVLFLCSDLNTFITGQNIVVDGGYTLL